MGIKDIKYEGHEGHKGHEGHHVLYFLNAAGSRISNMTFPCVMMVKCRLHLHLHLHFYSLSHSHIKIDGAYSLSIERQISNEFLSPPTHPPLSLLVFNKHFAR